MQTTTCRRFDELKSVGKLPTPTGVAMAILRLADSDGASVGEMARVLESDPAMAGRVLKLANSAQTGVTRPISTVRDAVTRLGIRAVRNVALGFSVISRSRSGACPQFDYERFWSRSIATAVAAQVTAAHLKLPAPDEAYTCGLLGQVGALALASLYPKEYGIILEQGRELPPEQFIQLEQDAFATDHNELSAAMLADWGLPDTCVDAVGSYEAWTNEKLAEDSPAHHLARILHLSMQIAAVCVAEDHQRRALIPEVIARGMLLDLSTADLIQLGGRTVLEWQEWGKLLDVKTQSVPSFADLVEEADQRPANGTRTGVADLAQSNGAMTIAPVSVLVVDDDPTELRLLTRHLTAAGHSVVTAKNGREALRLVLETDPQVVVTDWMMPEMDGVEFCRSLRQSKVGRQTYVIMLTGCEDEESLVKGLEAGADDFVVKPLRPKTLLARLRAGQRVIQLQQEATRDKEELQRFTAELAVANRKLQQAAFTDALTGLPNRRFAMERLEQEWAAVQHEKRTLACLVIDIDFFKKVNDNYGHDVGDVVLRETGAALTSSLRSSEIVCRLGGEEFVVLCPNSDAAAAMICAERLRSRVEANRIQFGEYDNHITLSIGVATPTAAMRRACDLLKAADQAVYAAKQSGRNRVCMAT